MFNRKAHQVNALGIQYYCTRACVLLVVIILRYAFSYNVLPVHNNCIQLSFCLQLRYCIMAFHPQVWMKLLQVRQLKDLCLAYA